MCTMSTMGLTAKGTACKRVAVLIPSSFKELADPRKCNVAALTAPAGMRNLEKDNSGSKTTSMS